MTEIMRTWGIAVIAILLCVAGIIGNLIIGPSLSFVLGSLTGAILIVLLNVAYNKYLR